MKNNLLTILLVLNTAVCFSQSLEEKFKRAKIYYSDSQQLSQLESLGVAVDHAKHKKGVFIISDFSTSELSIARDNGYNIEILIDDLEQHFLTQNNLKVPLRNLACIDDSDTYQTPVHFNDSAGSMGGYFTYQEVLDELDQMKALYPNLITTKSNISTFLTQGQPDNSVTPSIGEQWY